VDRGGLVPNLGGPLRVRLAALSALTRYAERHGDRPDASNPWRGAARERLVKNPRSGGVERVAWLLSALFCRTLEEEPELGALRYQLLTATAGALAAARREGSVRVVLLVQEFRTSLTVDQRLAANGADLNAFVSRLTRGALHCVTPGSVFGPYRVSAGDAESPPFFVGKVRHDLRATDA